MKHHQVGLELLDHSWQCRNARADAATAKAAQAGPSLTFKVTASCWVSLGGYEGKLEVAKLLLEHGASPAARDTTDLTTALHLAAAAGADNLALQLLSRGASPAARRLRRKSRRGHRA